MVRACRIAATQEWIAATVQRPRDGQEPDTGEETLRASFRYAQHPTSDEHQFPSEFLKFAAMVLPIPERSSPLTAYPVKLIVLSPTTDPVKCAVFGIRQPITSNGPGQSRDRRSRPISNWPSASACSGCFSTSPSP